MSRRIRILFCLLAVLQPLAAAACADATAPQGVECKEWGSNNTCLRWG